MQIHLSSRFKRAYKKLSRELREEFDEKIVVFVRDPHHPSLKTHKLHGKFQTCLAFRLRKGYRVFFEFSSSDSIDLLHVDPHDSYKKR